MDTTLTDGPEDTSTHEQTLKKGKPHSNNNAQCED
jgi:hypothetical protein